MSTVRDFHIMRNSLLMDKSLRAKNTHIVKGFAPGEFYDLTYPVVLIPKAVISVVDDTEETDASTSVVGNVLTNDFVSEGSLSVVRVARSSANVGVAVAGSSGGLFTIDSDGSWTFDPDGDFASLTGAQTATTSVSYHVSDGIAEDEGALTVTVSASIVGITVVATAVHEATSTSTQTYSLPSGLKNGDLVIVAAMTAYSSLSYPSISTSGYTQIGQITGNDTYDTVLLVSRKFMGSSPDGSVQVSGKPHADGAAGCCIVVLRGVDTTTPLDVAATTFSSQNAFPADPPSITPVTEGAVIYVAGAGAIAASSNASYTAISDGFDGVIGNFSGAVVDGSIGAGVAEWTSGAVDPGQFSSTTSNLSASRAAITVALRPAS